MFGLSLNAISVLAISQLTFIALFFAAFHRRQVIGQLLSLYSFCLICYVMANLPDAHLNFPVQYLFYRMATLAPAVLWLLSRFLFVDNARALWGLDTDGSLHGAAGLWFVCFQRHTRR